MFLIIKIIWGHTVPYWLRHYAMSRKVAGSRPDKVIEFFSSYLILPATLDPKVYSASIKNEYQKQKRKFWGEECGW
jgi:hypothetical protein